MNNTTWIALGLLGAGALWYLSQDSTQNETYFLVNGVPTPESKLRALGYIEPYPNKWILASDWQAALAANNLTTTPPQGSNDYFTILNSVIAAGLTLTGEIFNNQAKEKQALVDNILLKYTTIPSANYDASFPYDRSKLESFTIAQLKQIESGQYPLANVAGFEQNYFARTIKNC